MKRFNSNAVRASSHLAVTPEGTRRYERAVYKAAIERSEGKQVVKVREYLAPVKLGFKPTGDIVARFCRARGHAVPSRLFALDFGDADDGDAGVSRMLAA